MGARQPTIPASLEIHDPASRRAARTVLVLGGAAAAVPVLPPDPLEVVHLEDEEGDDPEEGLGPGHAVHRIGEPRAPAMGRAAQHPGQRVLVEGESEVEAKRPSEEPLRLELGAPYSRAPRPRPLEKRL